MAERVVHFFSEGTRLEGDLFVPEGLSRGERRPGIVLCHGYSGIRELILPDYARKFVAAAWPLSPACSARSRSGQRRPATRVRESCARGAASKQPKIGQKISGSWEMERW